MLDTIFQECCNLMSYLSSHLGVTYGYLNMLFFYIVQPIIYILILLWEIFILWRRTQNKIIRGGLILAVLTLMFLGYGLYTNYIGADLTALCRVKIDSMTVFAHSLGISYELFNVVVFIGFFLGVCLLHVLFLLFKKMALAWLIFVILFILSPGLITVFFT